jgi:electron transfer flavoprotein beta subunit
MLRSALAAGATHAVRVDLDPALDAAAVAGAVAPVVAVTDVVVCGAWSLDRGTGSFPAFLAHHLGAAQALGCTTVTADGDALVAERRLDGGRRELVRLVAPTVVSVEAGDELRRASLRAVLETDARPIEVVTPPTPPPLGSRPERAGPYRPRSRELEPPTGDHVRDRVLALTGALGDQNPSRVVRLDPSSAADRLLAALGEHGIGPDATGVDGDEADGSVR